MMADSTAERRGGDGWGVVGVAMAKSKVQMNLKVHELFGSA
jgi:hypothetical protein